jgi:ubiquinone/menaquinone biosynthesis C-methylase UbiE
MFTMKLRADLTVRAYNGVIGVGDRVLDVGCGNGFLTQWMGERLGCDVVGTDIVAYSEGIEFVLMCNGKIPFPNNSFDFATLNDVLHHTYDQAPLLSECLRVAQCVIVVEPKPTVIVKVLDKVLNFIHNRDMPTPLTFRKFGDWVKLFTDMGVQTIGVKRMRLPWWYPMSVNMYMLVSG